MPTLKQLTCNVEWELSQTPLQEFQTTYSDGYVETYLAVPELPTPFSIHLQSNGYIAPGLSIFVYIDGVYQCNRNRQNLKIPDENTTKKQTEVNFRVRQREQMSENGTFYGKPWKFERVNIRTLTTSQPVILLMPFSQNLAQTSIPTDVSHMTANTSAQSRSSSFAAIPRFTQLHLSIPPRRLSIDVHRL